MYSEEEKKVIKEFERKSFRKLKEKENKIKISQYLMIFYLLVILI